MTAILRNLRQLEAALKLGEISKEEFDTIKDRMLDSIEDATEVEYIDDAPEQDTAAAPSQSQHQTRSETGSQTKSAAASHTQSETEHSTQQDTQDSTAKAAIKTAKSPAQDKVDTGPVIHPSLHDKSTQDPVMSLGSLFGLVLLGLAAALIATLLLGKIIGDMMIAATLSLTVCAALLVSSFKQMEDKDNARP